jgi:hypothetical protein
MQSALDVIKNVVQIAFYAISAVAVIYGLRTWKRELKGKTRYESAKSIITGAYGVREAIQLCRSAAMHPSEYANRQALEGESAKQKELQNSYYAYMHRFNRVIDSLKSWQPTITEAEALFGKEARDQARKLECLTGRLRGAIEIYHQLMAHDAFDGKVERQASNIIFGANPDQASDASQRESLDDGGFQTELDASVDHIRKYFARYME